MPSRQARDRLARFPDLPQGSLKKIEIDLLLADLAFKLGDTLLGNGELACCFHAVPSRFPVGDFGGRPARPGNAFAAPLPGNYLASDTGSSGAPRALRKRCRVFPGQHSLHRRELKLSTPDTLLLHQFSFENCPLFSMSHFWGALHYVLAHSLGTSCSVPRTGDCGGRELSMPPSSPGFQVSNAVTR